jgi:hypothetical protein
VEPEEKEHEEGLDKGAEEEELEEEELKEQCQAKVCIVVHTGPTLMIPAES